jgi:alcohol dehydrogenase class IV
MNVERGWNEFGELLDVVEPGFVGDKEKKSRRFAQIVRELSNKLNVPQTLGQWGISRANVDQVVALMQPLQGAFDQNPVPFLASEDVRKILLRHTA